MIILIFYTSLTKRLWDSHLSRNEKNCRAFTVMPLVVTIHTFSLNYTQFYIIYYSVVLLSLFFYLDYIISPDNNTPGKYSL